jgi:hypothetical protein
VGKQLAATVAPDGEHGDLAPRRFRHLGHEGFLNDGVEEGGAGSDEFIDVVVVPVAFGQRLVVCFDAFPELVHQRAEAVAEPPGPIGSTRWLVARGGAGRRPRAVGGAHGDRSPDGAERSPDGADRSPDGAERSPDGEDGSPNGSS